MEEDSEDKDDTKRRTRNLSEKKRRDQFNLLVNELNSMVCPNNRKMDKSTVLKSTISFLKNHNEVTVKSREHDVQDDWKPPFLSNEEFTYLVLESLEGFLVVFSTIGRIYYVSESVTSLLGHSPIDMLNKNIFDLICEADRPSLYELLQTTTNSNDPMQNKETEVQFQCHMKRGPFDFKDHSIYELVQFSGHFRTNKDLTDCDDPMSTYQTDNDDGVLFVCTGCLCTPHIICDVSLVDVNRIEFTSRHSLEWKFLFLDHRAPPIIGYLPFEVLGTSGYDYYHFDDLEKVVSCHEELMQKGELTSCHYRFLTKGQQWIWLQSRFYITYHQWNSKPEFVVCTHRVVSHAGVSKSLKAEGGDYASSKCNLDRPESTSCASPPYAKESSFVPQYHELSQQSSTIKSSPSNPVSPSGRLWSQPHRHSVSSKGSSHSESIANSVKSTYSNPVTPSEHVWLQPQRYHHEVSEAISQSSDVPFRSRSKKGGSLKSASGGSSSSATTDMTGNRSAPTPGMSWTPSQVRYIRSNSGSASGEWKPAHRNASLHDVDISPQHVIGAEYLESVPYVSGVLPLPLPVIMSDQRNIPSPAAAVLKAVTPNVTSGVAWPQSSHRFSSSASALLHDNVALHNRQVQKTEAGELIPQHSATIHYLDSPYVNGMLQLPVPVIVSPEHAQIQLPRQEQLQRKHEHLQQMIVRQQEELRQVQEQLLLARLGVLPPILNVSPHYNQEDGPSGQRLPQIVYESSSRPAIASFPPQPPSQPPDQPPMP